MPYAAVSANPPRAARATDRANGLSMEGAYDVAARVAAISASGRTVANLAIGEPSFATPEHIVNAGVQALRDGETRYAPVGGIAGLREAVAASVRERGHAQADPANVLITPGAKPALFYTLLALLDRGDEVLVPDPGFPAYASVARFAEAVPIGYDALHPDGINVDALASLITPRTRVLVLNSPGNPSGRVLDREVLGGLAELALRHDLAVISDECYGKLTYDGTAVAPSITCFPELVDRVVMVDSFSKTYAMTGWRLGYAVVPPRLVRTVHRLAVNGHSCTPAFVQRAGIAALTGTQGPWQRMRSELRGRRDVLVTALGRLPGISCAPPSGAFYALADCSRLAARLGRSTSQLADWLLDSLGVASVAGTAFGARGAGHLRFSFAAAPDQIALAVERLHAALGEVAP
jgi:aspartate/methionine/tyrosine aminotransferase